jgi:hypothetical protein
MRQIRKGGPSRPPSLRKNINMDIFVYFFKLYSLWFSNFQVSFKQFVKYNALVINMDIFVYFFKLYSLWFSNFQVSFKQFVKYNALVMTISHIIIFLNNLLNIML